eukprot:TRINITY_DN20539_c0_g2_i2.p1 TRINITY_DN20539_c0_g2~~TRINITY_DN20539_c0_g2_i2.p1  ORF type:complete len:3366 (-),score=560.65 TRINITY_DN20539_c0_g2_i2:231-9053(-)
MVWSRDQCTYSVQTFDCRLFSALPASLPAQSGFDSAACQVRSVNLFPLKAAVRYSAFNFAPGQALFDLSQLEQLVEKWEANEDWTLSLTVSSNAPFPVKFGFVAPQTATYQTPQATSWITGPIIPAGINQACEANDAYTSITEAETDCFGTGDTRTCSVVINEEGRGAKWRKCTFDLSGDNKNWQISELQALEGVLTHHTKVLDETAKVFGASLEAGAFFIVEIPAHVVQMKIQLQGTIPMKDAEFRLLYDQYLPYDVFVEDIYAAPGSENTRCNPVPTLQFDPADACTWLFGLSSHATEYECADGHVCATGDNCCADHGKVARCPASAPLMCANVDEATNTDVGCSTDCTSRGGLRQCRPSNMGLTDCFWPQTRWSPVMPGQPAVTEANKEACQLRCQLTVGCRHWTFQDSTGQCELVDKDATMSQSIGYTSGPPSCVSRLEVSEAVNTSQAMNFQVYFSCTDTMGQTSAVSRTVEIGCEGPNPKDIYGGNNVLCDQVLETKFSPDVETCSRRCLLNLDCEAWMLETVPGDCKVMKYCNGRYERDANIERQVGYCRRIDHLPWADLDECTNHTRIDEQWQETDYRCKDREDPYPPTPVKTTNLNILVPGEYWADYSCTDLMEQQASSKRVIFVSQTCDPTTLKTWKVPCLTKITTDCRRFAETFEDAPTDPTCHEPDGADGNAECVGAEYQVVPCIEMVDPRPEEGTGSRIFRASDICSPQCVKGYDPSVWQLTCERLNVSTYITDWSSTFVCAEEACDAPPVLNVALHGCAEGPRVTHQGECTPSCADGYQYFMGDAGYDLERSDGTNKNTLSCFAGTLTPLMYRCKKIAQKPNKAATVMYDMFSATLLWGDFTSSNDCVFERWHIQKQLQKVPDDILNVWPEGTAVPQVPQAVLDGGMDIWRDVPGCMPDNMMVRAQAGCTAIDLWQGSTYLFRVREECSNSRLLDSPWNEDANPITTLFVMPPEVIFKIPAEDTLVKPEAVMIATDVNLKEQALAPGHFIIKKDCPWIPPVAGEFNFTNVDVVGTCPNEDEMQENGCPQLTGGRILILTPPKDFFGMGCTFNITIERGFVGTEASPAKPFPPEEWGFVFIDIRPRWTSVSAKEITISSLQLLVEFHLATRFTCWADFTNDVTTGCGRTDNPVDYGPNPGYTLKDVNDPDDPGVHWLPARCTRRYSQDFDEAKMLDKVVKDWDGIGQKQALDFGLGGDAPPFYINGLFPGTPFHVDCLGHKIFNNADRFWVDIEPQPDAIKSATYTTKEDLEAGLGTVEVEVYSICPGDQPHLDYVVPIDIQTLQFGYTFLVKSWKELCNNDNALSVGQTAVMQALLNVTMASSDSTFHWKANRGPLLDYEYEKESGTEEKVVTAFFRWEICPLAYYNDATKYPCTEYELASRLVDVTFEYSNYQIMFSPASSTGPQHQGYYEVPVRRLPVAIDQERNVEMYMTSSIHATSSSEDFKWEEISVKLGSSLDGFRLVSWYDKAAEEIQFELTGQGRGLPFIMEWKGANFLTPFKFHFQDPVIETVFPEVTSIEFQTLMTFTFSNMPDLAILNENITDAGYNMPQRYFQMQITKHGRVEQLCSSTWFESGSWTKAYCNLHPGALSDLRVRFMTWDYLAREYVVRMETTVGNRTQYAQPVVQRIKIPGDFGEYWDGTMNLGEVARLKHDVSDLYIMGVGLPNPIAIKLQGAYLPGYDLRVEGLDPVRWPDIYSWCDGIDFINNTALRCNSPACRSFAYVPAKPRLRLYLGDLVSATDIERQLTFPRPVVMSVSPTSTTDVGLGRDFEIQGDFFGETECRSGLNKPEGYDMQYVGHPSGANVRFGELAARCVVSKQNNTYIACTVVGPIMYPREPGGDPSVLQPPRKSTLQPFVVEVGADPRYPIGDGLLQLNEDTTLPTFVTENLPALRVAVSILDCPSTGMQREYELHHTCVACRAGRFMTYESPDWPLVCEDCYVGEYTDDEGSTQCKPCPSGTTVIGEAKSLEACICMEGWFSPYYNVSLSKDLLSFWVGNATGGKECQPCHGTDVAVDPEPFEECGTAITVYPVCGKSDAHACIQTTPPLLVFAVCTLTCPGGTLIPWARPKFWVMIHQQYDVDESGVAKFQPKLLRCDPPRACRGSNLCELQYEEASCSKCKFGYWKHDKKGFCMPCGFEQVIATVIVSGLAVFGSFGVLIGVSSFLRFKSDLEFRHKLLTALKQNVIAPLKKSKTLFKVARAASGKPVYVTISHDDVGLCYPYLVRKDLGVGFRIDEFKQIHLTGIHPWSPLYGKVNPDWKLYTINGKRAKGLNEDDVLAQLANAKFPVRIGFNAKVAKIKPDENDDGEELDFDDDRKTVIVLMGCMNSFTAVASFDFEWPDLFKELAALAAKFAFDLNFFKPECSVETPYSQKWLGFLAVPYMAMGPLMTAHLIARFVTLRGLNHQAYEAKAAELVAATARVVCVAAIVMMPFHIKMVIIPYCCVPRGEGLYFLSANPSTECSMENPEYVFMVRVTLLATINISCFYAFLLSCIRKCYWWQFVIKQRASIPFYCAMVESSVCAQRGYHKGVRKRVAENISSVMAFNVKPEQLRIREECTLAVTSLGYRSRLVQQVITHRKKEELPAAEQWDGLLELIHYGDMYEERQGDRNKTTAEIADLQVACTKAKRRFKAGKKKRSPKKPTGHILTYGWIFIVNQFMRSILSSIVLEMTSATLTVIGACFQMSIIGANVALLLVFKPYLATRIVWTEIVMLFAFFLILWAAVVKDLLTSHVNSESLQHLIDHMGTCINAFALLAMGLTMTIPIWNITFTVTKVARAATGRETLLNQIAWKGKLQKEREHEDGKELAASGGLLWCREETSAISGATDKTDQELLALVMEQKYPVVNRTLQQLQAGEVGSQNQSERLELIKLVELIRANTKLLITEVDLAPLMSVAEIMALKCYEEKQQKAAEETAAEDDIGK